nr:hypothetical protein CFP56_04544 [Quercus suber]
MEGDRNLARFAKAHAATDEPGRLAWGFVGRSAYPETVYLITCSAVIRRSRPSAACLQSDGKGAKSEAEMLTLIQRIRQKENGGHHYAFIDRDIITRQGLYTHSTPTASGLNSARCDVRGRTIVHGCAGADAEDGAVGAADRLTALQLGGDVVEHVDERSKKRGRQPGEHGQLGKSHAGGEAQRALCGLVGGVGAIAVGGNVKLLVAVHCAGVTTDAADCRLTVWNGVGICSISTVPVGGDLFVSKCPCEVVIRAGDGVEALQYIPVQNTLGRIRSVVCHETVNESESGLADSHSSEWLIGEIWVLGHVKTSFLGFENCWQDRTYLGNGFLEAGASEVSKHIEIVVGR